MKRLFVYLFLVAVSYSFSFSQEFFIDTVFFDFDMYDLREEGEGTIDSALAKIEEHPSYYIEIFGHTDNIGTEYYNLELSRLRAQQVYDKLVEKGMDKARVYFDGFGTERPAATNETFEGRQRNRRAEIAVIYTLDTVVDEEAMALLAAQAEQRRLDSIAAAEAAAMIVEEEKIEANNRPMEVSTNKQTIIYGEEGTRVIIPPRAFDTEEDKVTMEMVEMFDRSDMLLVGMPTVTRDGPLETVGMVMLEARNSRGRLVKVRPETPITVEIPSDQQLDNLGVYEGRGGNKTSRLKRKSIVKDFNPVQNWVESNDVQIAFVDTGEIGRHYEFEIKDLERFNLARPLHYAMNSDPKAEGIDVEIKLKGKRFEKDTKVMVVGDRIQTLIPLRKSTKRIYRGNNIQQLDTMATVILYAFQEDNRGAPYIASRRVNLDKDIKIPNSKFLFFTVSKEEQGRPTIFAKMRFRRVKNEEELVKALREL
ncbi:MAG: OmpA family protein [Bacteroidota bacterium]